MVGEGRWGLAVRAVAATLAVAPKGLGLVGVEVPKGLGRLEVCMWGYSGRLERMGRVLGMSKSNGVAGEAATRFVGAGLAAGYCGWRS